eukprot:TRINITY_DN813_c0_g1_i1.p1 TRINITY_DN813_c0_g1~~TRINITY_DN813_c0_g1_i1.p1  ORF type:complete len:384 (-),score=91.43 TRINITY_DN813_c0_g1_i1:36-1187(-)
MKYFILSILLLVLSTEAKPISEYAGARALGDIAFAFTGAGGRISQEAALAETLINGTYPGGVPVMPSYMAGVSSGALVAVGINAVLEATENALSGGLTFYDFNQLLFGLDNDDVFQLRARDLVSNIDHGFVLDTDPLRTTITGILNRIGYSVLGDLYLPTYITVVDQRSGVDLRLYSLDTRYSNLPLIDILMSTTAIPVVFSPQQIPALTTFTEFIDGGTGIDYVPIIPLLNNPNVQVIYAITYNQAFTYGPSDDSLDAERGTLVKYAARAYDITGAGLAIGALTILQTSNKTGYVYQPNFAQTFATTDFESEQEQFNLALAWAQANAPINVDNYALLAADQTLPAYTSADPNSGSIFTNSGVSSVASYSLLVSTLLLLASLC